MFAKASLILAGSIAVSSVMAHANVGAQRRELVYALRQMSERAEIYPPTASDLPAPNCASDYDTPASTGDGCICGSGRVQTEDGLCQVSEAALSFASTPLEQPQPVNVPITWGSAIETPEDAGGAYLCAALVSQNSAAFAFYYEAGSCWPIGASGAFPSTDSTFPFTATGSSKVKRQAAGQTGSVGNSGGTIGRIAAAEGTTGCITDLGDAPQDTLTCVCGAGRVNTDASTCAYAASAGARMARKVRRDVFEGVPW